MYSKILIRLIFQCISSVAFVKNESDILEQPCWVMLINVVAMDMLKSKIPPGLIYLKELLELVPNAKIQKIYSYFSPNFVGHILLTFWQVTYNKSKMNHKSLNIINNKTGLNAKFSLFLWWTNSHQIFNNCHLQLTQIEQLQQLNEINDNIKILITGICTVKYSWT